MPDPTTAIITTLGLVLVAVITFFGSRYAAKQSRRAEDRTTDVASRQVDVGEWQAIVEALRGEIKRLTERVDSLEADRELERAAHRSLLAYTRTLLAWARRLLPNETPPVPPAAFVDELVYTTER